MIVSLEEAQRLGQIGSWAWTVEPDTTSWSKELYRILGRDPAGPSPPFAEHADIYVAESWTRLRAAVEVALRTGAPYRLDLQYRRPDGATGWLDVRGEAVRDEDGKISGLRGTVQAISPAAPAG